MAEVQYNPGSGQYKDRMAWERHGYSPSKDGSCATCGQVSAHFAHKPYDPKQNPYPRMMFMARKREDGRLMCGAPEPHPSHFKEPAAYWFEFTAVDQFNRNCQRVVNSEDEYRQAVDEGWRDDPKEAMAHAQKLEDMISEAAAHRHWQDRNMSEKAKKEAAEADEASDQHLAEIPEKPRKRGRPRKQAEA